MSLTSTSGVWAANYWETDGLSGIGDVDFSAPSDSSSFKTGEIAEFALDDPVTGPGPGDGYAAQYSATITVDGSETLSFYIGVIGDADLIVDGKVVISLRCEDVEGAQSGPCPDTGGSTCLCSAESPVQRDSVAVDLGSGTHTIEVRHYDHGTGQGIALDWSTGNFARQPMDLEIPAAASIIDDDGGGEWGAVKDWPLIGVHAILTPDNKVLTFGTDENGVQGGHLIYDVWDYQTDTHYTLENKTPTDLFCSVPILVPSSGEILIAGGDARPQGGYNLGVDDVNVFNYQDMSISPSPTGDMAYQRWYPTAITLANGKILMLGGMDGAGNGVGMPELYTPGVGWKSLTGAYSGTIAEEWWYPRTWLNSDGNVVMFGTNAGGKAAEVFLLDPSGNGTLKSLGNLPFLVDNTMPAIMYEQDKVLLLGLDGSSWIMDISGDAPSFSQTADIGNDRKWSNLVVLADGSVMVSGGSRVDNELRGVANQVAIWDPRSGEWSLGDAADIARLYHSTTILLPDATVLSLGGGAPGPLTNTNGEIYRPPYLFDEDGNVASRPTILEAPEEIEQREIFEITVDNADNIERLTLVKAGSVTHALNMSTTKLELAFTQADANTLKVTPTENANVLSPGQWMLFAFDVNGTPSIAATLQVGLGGEAYSDNFGGFITLSGSAAYDESSGIVTLTPDALDQTGAVMSNQRIDLRDDFDFTFNVFLGDKDGLGADGVAFVLHGAPFGADAVGIGGGDLGAFGIANGLALEFDTYQNPDPAYGDLVTDHVAWVDTDTAQIATGTGPLDVGNIENGAWHSVSVSWDAQTEALSYSFDGQQGDTLSGDLAARFFGGSDFVYFGFTGATGGLSNLQQVQAVDLQGTLVEPGVEPPAPPIVDSIANMGGDVALMGDASFSATTGVITLTPDALGQTGAVMSNQRIDLRDDFDFTFNVFLGGKDGLGADGSAFVLHNSPLGADAVGIGGGDLGAFGIANGLALEFDTYQNPDPAYGDLVTDHVAWVDTDTAQIATGTGPLDVGNIENGAWHSVSVSWDAQTEALSYSFDGQQGDTLSGDLAARFFGGSDFVYFGFTGATGGLSNLQQVQAVDLQGTLVEPGVEPPAPPIVDSIANMGGDVALMGDASFSATTGVITLTPDALGQTGAVMSNQRIDLRDDFDFTFNVFLGGKDGLGADGSAFVLHNSPFGADAVGIGGGDLGAFGIANGLALEFDTYQNPGPAYGDLVTDHVAWVDTDTAQIATGTGPLDVGNIENGAWHSVSVSWDAQTEALSYSFDGQQGDTLSGDLAARFFGGSDFVYFGFTGATGGLSNLQQVQAVDLQGTLVEPGVEPPAPPIVDSIANMGGDVALMGDASFSATTGVITLTPDALGQTGAVMSNQRIDLRDDFDFTFNVFLGGKDGLGADGSAFVLHNSPLGADAVGIGGGDLGAFGIANGLALEFDTYQNPGPAYGDLVTDHVAWVDTDTAQIATGTGPLDVGNIENGAWHSVSVSWDAQTEALSYSFDGQQGDTLSGDLAARFFGGSDFVYFGFTGATGGLSNLQQVQAVDLQGTLVEPGVEPPAPPIVDSIANMGGDVALMGDASFSATTGVITLTPDALGQTGAVMSNQRIDLRDDFDFTFNVFLGGKDGLGADGSAFVLHNSPLGADAVGIGGGDLGAFGIANGLALEFDTYQNPGPAYGDLVTDHVAWVDTDTAQIATGTGPLDVGNIENGAWHSVSVSWDAQTEALSYSFDGQQGDTLSGDLAARFFGDSDFVYFGFTGATGGLSNLQQVQAVDLQGTLVEPGVEPPAPPIVDSIANMGGDVALMGDASFSATTGVITLTPDALGQTGAVMSNQRIDLRDDFDFTFNVFLGGKDGLGADGSAFVLHNSPFGADAVGIGGGDLGAFGIANGLALEFDTYQNPGPAYGDLVTDHVAWVDTDTAQIATGTGPLDVGNIENGAWHSVSVSWDAQTEALSYSFDGQQGDTLSGDLADRFFGDSDFVYFGFTGATGGLSNLQQVQTLGMQATLEDGSDIAVGSEFAQA